MAGSKMPPRSHNPKNKNISSRALWQLYFLLIIFGLYQLFGGYGNDVSNKKIAKQPVGKNYAYITLLCDDIMAEAAMVLVHSVRRTGSPYDILVLTMNVSNSTITGLRQIGAIIVPITDPVPYPFVVTADRMAINKPCRYSKLLMWNMVQYQKMVYLDSDLLVIKNIDDLFERGQLSAVPDILPPDKFNSGLMVIEPNREVFLDMLGKVATTLSPNVGDQGFLNNYFSDWYMSSTDHRLDYSFNSLIRITPSPIWKFFVGNEVRVLHFSGSTKPWNTMYDKQFPTTREFDPMWWYVYDDMYQLLGKKILEISNNNASALPQKLSGHCKRDYMAYSRVAPIQNKLSVVVSCFDRFDLLVYMVQRYSSMPFVHKIYIVWGNTKVKPFHNSYFNVSTPVEIRYYGHDSLNDRFLPIESMETEGVLVCDDDIEVSIEALHVAFNRWQIDKYRLVGFFPRSHYRDPTTQKLVYVLSPRQEYSVVLTKMFIMHANYLSAYTCNVPKRLLDYINSNKNCEDITMNFIATQLSGLPPLLMEDPSKRDYGTTSGLSSRGSHDFSRSVCMNDIEEMLGFMSLRNTSETITYFERHKSVHVPKIRQLRRVSNVQMFPVFNEKEFSTRLQFMSKVSFDIHMHSVEIAEIPSQSLNNYLCISGGNKNDPTSPANKYALLQFGSLPSDVLQLSGSTLVIHSQFGFEGRFLFLSMMSNFLPWRKAHGCFGPSRVVLYHDGSYVTEIGDWAKQVMAGALGPLALPFVPPEPNSIPVCFEESIVHRQRDTVNFEECDSHIKEVGQLIHSYCRESPTKIAEDLFNDPEANVRIIFVGGVQGWGRISWFNFEDIGNDIKEECTAINLSCEIIMINQGDFCQVQVLGFMQANLIIGPWGDPLMDSIVFLKPTNSILELLPEDADKDEAKYAKSIAENCLGLQYTQHYVSQGSDVVISWIQNRVKDLMNRVHSFSIQQVSVLDSCSSMVIHA